jgi:hypothetical protein
MTILTTHSKAWYTALFSRKTAGIISQVLDVPRRPLNPFALFVKDQFSKAGATTGPVSEKVKAIAQDWRNLSEEKKKDYVGTAEKDRMRYFKEMEAFGEKLSANGQILYAMLGFNRDCINKRYTKRDLGKEAKKWIEELPKAPAATARGHFMASKMSGKKADLKQVAAAWSNLTEKEREDCEAQWKLDNQRYVHELKKFLV